MTGQELLDYLRADVLRDNAQPYLWSDSHILRMLSEGERDFCRKTYALADSSQTITTTASINSYTLQDGVVWVFSAALDGYARDLGNYTRKWIPSNLITTTGLPQIFTLDEAAGVLRLYPVPDAAYQIDLRVVRLPAVDISETVSPEVPVQYHLDIAEYAAWRLLLANDVDGGNTGAALRHKEDYLKRVDDAKREYYRIRMGANPNARSSCTWKRN